MQTSLVQEWLYAILSELNRHKGKAVLCFALVTIAVVIAGFLWPKQFESSALIFADDQNIIKPLLAGQAEVTRPTQVDQLEVVEQRITSNQLMGQVLLETKQVDNLDDRYTVQPLIKSTLAGVRIESAGKSHIRIAYRSPDKDTAYRMASAITNVFIQDSSRTKREESGEAFTFIDNQVKTYKEQLQAAEDRLKEFKSANPGSSEQAISQRMTELRSNVETMSLDLQVARAKRDELRQQISHESQYIAQSYRADVYRTAMSQAQSKLDTLRLSYQETYPDIVALKQQIEDLRRSIGQAELEPTKAADSGSSANPVYQKLKSDLSEAEVNVKTLELKLASARRLLGDEVGNSKQSAEYQAQLAELTRDYTVTKEIYEDLLARKEKARMSVALDVQGQGLNYRIQEPAAYPTAPVGMRFIHFFLAAPLLGLLVPLAALVAYIQLDPRMRFVARVEEALPQTVPVMVVVPHMRTATERRVTRAEWSYLAIFAAVVLGLYVVTAILRLSGVV